MNEERMLKVIVGPHVSEKGTMLAEAANQHVFKVAVDATRDEVRQAVEKLFEVKVSSVRVLNQQGKRKRLGRSQGRRNHWRKAYVTLEPGYDIELAGNE
ncbi:MULTISPECIES: 50S ribosomal protein L23 [Ectothiorhodospira]|uniref:Large ribosomal subunit protein uL23 n=1 Tax=Ectothiorhodospira haloalkaliphila TaxID=421628 RepID=W8KRW9_9GAMM|nr:MULTISPECIES: 50S ribosomal protein L23 [Ectothiorhodospira]AHK79742.1 50S ribosomal protein L23 [Ectothiorhodospira haloalkaliphila]ANB02264.1 50S ribosomal protein L23 [Ectothiorhodospira sp. BSL-9]MCG5495388.1 50S ribosomal protein L23 [Ectothiorhodospira variabilis]MCG5498767.1 50S ribosomal protein L23 [Ectothiorhodospira variabilis]MCG5504986.1 50S ribosomal protein L23 [Ectothiorhodospira variabilis]